MDKIINQEYRIWQQQSFKYQESAKSVERPSCSDSYDNMRGFDPASEDVMDDNGMNRYMDNNDEGGWD
ncbi:MAG: hypothetical protein IJ562_12100 [Prevotella sp.]|nr:hypothetical protein [Prevotella sp.]